MHACMCVCARMYACYQFISDCNQNLDRFHRSVCENACVCVCARCVSGTPFPCVCLSACACATLCACYSGVCACMCLPQCLGMCIFSMRAYVHVSVWVSGLGYLWLHGCGSVCQCVSVVVCVCVCVCRCVAGVHSMQRLAWCRMVTYKVCLRRKIQHQFLCPSDHGGFRFAGRRNVGWQNVRRAIRPTGRKPFERNADRTYRFLQTGTARGPRIPRWPSGRSCRTIADNYTRGRSWHLSFV